MYLAQVVNSYLNQSLYCQFLLQKKISTTKIISMVKNNGLLEFQAQPNLAKEQLLALLQFCDTNCILKQNANIWESSLYEMSRKHPCEGLPGSSKALSRSLKIMIGIS